MTTERQDHLAPVTYLFGRPTDDADAPAALSSAALSSAALSSAPELQPATTPVDFQPAAIPAAAAFEPRAAVTAEPNELPADLAALRTAIAEVEATPPAEPEPLPKTTRRAANVSMHALTKRGLSVSEMSTLLERRELDPDDVLAEVERLERVGLLDDAALAENLVRTLQERKGLGRSAIVAELRRRKVESSAIETALEQLDGDDELARATELALKRAPQLRNLDADAAKRRLSGYLMRRGYNGSIVGQAVAAALTPASFTSAPFTPGSFTPGSSTSTRRGPRFE
jgi:regulatory protein